MNYENIYTREIISENCYEKLSDHKKESYRITSSVPTHRYNDDSNDFSLIETVIAAEVVSDMFDNSSTPDNDVSIPDDSPNVDMGGGDFGGAGAGGEW